jgi:hypothetical protein
MEETRELVVAGQAGGIQTDKGREGQAVVERQADRRRYSTSCGRETAQSGKKG